MKTLLNTKYIKIVIDWESWALPLFVDWRHNNITRPYYVSFLCLHFEVGVDPYSDIEL
ncbi:hypothetical protein LCGC14_0404390 [marine sediment metagenome]|uniref:Uncharacterized protein n=1 Tax=marine sediment metagenome TaxID=412755 RepID=A0A0F9SW06_9ZZZZ